MADLSMTDAASSEDSNTTSESESEELENEPPLPARPSIKSAARSYRSKLFEAAGVPPGAMTVFDEREDMTWGMQYSKRTTNKTQLNSWVGDEEVEMGAVIVDQEVPEFEFQSDVDLANDYWKWQIVRQLVETTTSNNTPFLEGTALSNMGLFALLPGELRNRVYRLALIEGDEPFTIVGEPETCSLGACTHSKLPTAVPGILSSCRQIRHESMPIFYAENTLKFDTRTVRSRCSANFLRAIDHYGRLIPRIILEILVWEPSAPPRNLPQVQRCHEIRVDCTSGFKLEMDAGIKTRTKQAYTVIAHAEKLAERAQKGESMEQLLLEFVWSDLMADLVFRCSKELR